jgi:hypothetical protein
MAFWRSGSTSKKKIAKSPRAKSGPASRRLGVSQARPFLKGFLGVVILAAAGVGWTYAKPYLVGYTNAHFDAPADIRFTDDLPAVEGLRDELSRTVFSNVAADPLGEIARDSLDALRLELLMTGWFDHGTLRIRRDLQKNEQGEIRDTVIIDGPFRKPFALVRAGQFDYLVDEHSTRLPVTYPRASVTVIPVMTGVRGPVPEIGELWAGRDLTDGIGLLKYLNRKQPGWLKQVREIDVSNASGSNERSPRLVLVTPDGCRIGWGRSVGEEAGIDIPARDKIQLLDEYAKSRQGKIGDPLGLLRVDLPLMTVEKPPAQNDE